MAPSAAHADIQASQTELASVKEQIDDLNTQAEQASEELNAATAALEELRRQSDEQSASVAAKQSQLADMVCERYMASSTQVSDLLEELASGSFDALVTNLRYLSDRNDAMSQTVCDAEAAQSELARQAQEQAQMISLIEQRRSELDARSDELERYKDEVGQEVVQQIMGQSNSGIIDDSSVADAARQNLASNGYVKNPNATTTSGTITEEQRKQILDFAYSKVGRTTYVYGAGGPDSYDCSGLVQAAYRSAGLSLPHSSAADMAITDVRSLDELEAGDLVFWSGHVAIYAGNGQTIESLPGYGVVMFRIWGNPIGGGNPYA